MLRKFISFFLILSFSLPGIILPSSSHAQELRLPDPGIRVNLSPTYNPPILKGVRIYSDSPFRFDFILDPGDSRQGQEDLKQESLKLIKYFLASVTVPEKDLWVNLSPYEKDRTIPPSFGLTEMGRDLLAEDYMLKQITASLIYPENEIGKEFWKRIYAQSAKQYGTTNIPVNTFNKVWIVPQKAVVYENPKAKIAYVVESKLKVMLEEDYLALSRHGRIDRHSQLFVIPAKAGIQNKNGINTLGSQIVREIVIPQLNIEINENKNFAQLREVYNSLILAAWYKKKIKESILGQVYADKNKIAGIQYDNSVIQGMKNEGPGNIQRIYDRYIQAFKKGAYNYIKDDIDPATQEIVPRKYFSGGVSFRGMTNLNTNTAIQFTDQLPVVADGSKAMLVQMKADTAMTTETVKLLGITPGLGMSPQALANEIKKEIKSPGSGNIPLVFTFSDEHGTIDKMDLLLIDMLRLASAGKNIPADFVLDPDKTLKQQGINLEDFKGQLFIHNIGDFMDRGPFGVKVFRRSKELIDAGISDFIIGNHDQWMFMNLIGLHLPYYDNFNFYGYYDSYDKAEGKVEDILRYKHSTMPETRKASWWAQKLSEFRKFHQDQQKKRWQLEDDQVNGPNGLFSQVTKGTTEDQKKDWYLTPEGKIWNKFRGFDPNVGEVATGVKSVGLVSIVWWEKLLKDFDLIYYKDLNGSHVIEKDTVEQEAWATAINMIRNQIIPTLRKTLEEHIDRGQWWWRIFEAINLKNYTSPEWWAMDWAYHKGWGPNVFKEINDTYYHGDQVVTTENYLDEDTALEGVAVLKEIAQFFKDHYTLHIKDIMQIDLMHAFLPIDPKTGEFYFNYKSQKYRGKSVGTRTRPFWEGLNAISQDIREAPNNQTLIGTVYEAITIVNAWYADNTTEAKVSHVADALQNIGVRTVLVANGIHWLVTGHLPMHDFLKLKEDRRRVITGHFIPTGDEQQGFAFSDGGMGERFGGGGKYLMAGRDGLKLRGFPGKKSEKIVDNPPTIIFKKDPGGVEREKVVYRNDNPISANVFLPGVASNINFDQANSAMASDLNHVGGIDLTPSHMNLQVQNSSGAIPFHSDPSTLQQLKEASGFVPVIIKIQPILNLRSYLALQ